MLLTNLCLSEISKEITTPCYVLDYDSLLYNLNVAKDIQEQSGAKILLALKGYSFWREFDDVRKILCGATCSGLNEAILAYEEILNNNAFYDGVNFKNDFKNEICVFSPAYKIEEVEKLSKFVHHLIFNSFSQFEIFKKILVGTNVSLGLRVNPMYSEVTPLIYNPCAPKSRLGITPIEFEKNMQKYEKYEKDFFLKNFDGIHFHTHCEQNSDSLKKTLKYLEFHFEKYIKQSKWVNFGGGHHITKKDYNKELLIELIKDFRFRFNVEVYLEPGEAIGWESGDLIGSVIDIVKNDGLIAILDISASAHMPDCLEMPYRPKCYKINKFGEIDIDIQSAKEMSLNIKTNKNTQNVYEYRFAGPTCLAGDVIGDFSFNSPVEVGDKIGFIDMMHYTIVKNTTFNGVPLPSLGVIKNNNFKLLKKFDYRDFKARN